jgi:hypothetical protein
LSTGRSIVSKAFHILLNLSTLLIGYPLILQRRRATILQPVIVRKLEDG